MFQSTSPNLVGIDAKTAALSKMMPDKLKQYAILHQDDIITMSLISSIQKKRNEEKLAQQARQANAVPPKVNEQLIQSINPEESGIASLPAENMTYAAEGGIVGYAGDGEQGQLITDPMGGISGSISGSDTGDTPTFMERIGLGNVENRKKLEEIEDFKRRKAAGKLTNEEKRKLGMPVEPDENIPSGYSRAKDIDPELRSFLIKDAIANGRDPNKITFNLATPGGRTATMADLNLEKSTRPLTTQAPSVGSSAPVDAPPSARVSTQADTRGPMTVEEALASYKRLQGELSGSSPKDQTIAQEEINALSERAAQEKLKSVQEDQAITRDMYKGQESRIGTRESELEKTKESLQGFAILQAGLAMMQSTGKGFSGIAEGAEKGLQTYQAGLSDYTKAKAQLDEARDRIDILKTNIGQMSAKELRDARSEVNQTLILGKQNLVNGLMKRSDAGDKAALSILEQLNRGEIAEMEVGGRRDVAEIANDTARIVAEGKADTAEGKTQFLIAAKKIDGLINEAKGISDSAMGMTKDGQARLQILRSEIDKLRQAMVVPGTESTMPPAAGTRYKFDAKGNPI